MPRFATPALLAALLLLVPAVAAQERRPLDHDAYAIWNHVQHTAVSRDGAWALVRFGPDQGDDTLRVVRTDGMQTYDLPRGGTDAAFTPDGRFVVARLRPPHETLRRANRREGNDRAGARREAPPDTLALLALATGEVTRIPGVASFRLPETAGGVVAYRLARPDTTAQAAADTTAEHGRPNARRAPERRDAGRTLVLRNLASGAERTFPYATDAYLLSRDGRWLVYAAATPDSTGDGVFAVETATGRTVPVLTGPGSYTRLVLDEDGRQVAFLTNRDDPSADGPARALYRAELGQPAARVADATTPGLPEGWIVSEHGALAFSQDGRRLFFGTAPAPPPDTTATLEGEPVRVDIWHWRDPRLQTVQLVERERDLRRTFRAVAHLDQGGRVVQLAHEDLPDVTVGARGNADVAVASTDWPYRQELAWDFPQRRDVYLVDVQTGERRLVAEGVRAVAQLSPEARYVTWWDREAATWRARPTTPEGQVVDLGRGIPHPLADETHDQPFPANPHGLGGWIAGDTEVLIYDRFDVWAVAPDRPERARAVTAGAGRREGVRYRVVDLEPEERALPADRPLLLSLFDLETKDAGYARVALAGGTPTTLVRSAHRYTALRKADDAERLVFRRENVAEFPDLWTADTDFANARRLTRLNPQQDRFRWATAERVTWTSLTGLPMEGILYRPDPFDPTTAHPLLVYFYDRHADGLHRHYAPAPHRSVIDPVFYASRGYVVFVPDVVYEEGFPGQSAYNSIMPGITALLERPYIDGARVGVQGHSWGGYQIAYLVTRTNLFAAAAAGAPVANMISAYGGIRWETGRSRMFQYERTQSRIGGSLWDRPMHYIENSPIFALDRVETPVLIMHNDRDGHVPFEQGIELFVGLYRLGKPVWLVNYNEQPHWPLPYHLRLDWQMRLQQFFDHFLKDAPAPRWLAEGIPATEKGRTLGFEPAEEPALPRPTPAPVVAVD